MPRGTPICTKCPRCKRGKYGEPRPEKGVAVLGHEVKISKGKGRAGGTGGPRFYGYRGIVECLDCGHRWLSTLEGVDAWRIRLGLAG